jgi:hypothetical protein
VKRTVMVVFDLALVVVAGSAAIAQSSVVQLAATAGSATDERGVRSSVVTLAPSVLFAHGSDVSLVLGANATRFATSASQIGGSAALSAHTPSTGGFALTLNTSASAAHASFDATFAQIDATPALDWTAGPFTLIGGMHAASGYAAVRDATATPLAPQTSRLISQSTSSIAATYGAELRLGAGSPVSTVISLREEPAHVGGLLVTDRLGGATMSFGAVSVSALAGHRDAPDERVDFASASAWIPLTDALALTMAGGKYPSNRLTGAAGGRFFSTGLSIRLGGSRPVAAPRPAGVSAPLPEFTRFAIRATGAARVDVAGDWNAWALTPATRAANGVWYVDLRLHAGEYRYAFLVDGREWRVPEGVAAVDDGFGSKAAYVTVRTADSVLAKHNQEER